MIVEYIRVYPGIRVVESLVRNVVFKQLCHGSAFPGFLAIILLLAIVYYKRDIHESTLSL